jgi:hypothetical protein
MPTSPFARWPVASVAAKRDDGPDPVTPNVFISADDVFDRVAGHGLY